MNTGSTGSWGCCFSLPFCLQHPEAKGLSLEWPRCPLGTCFIYTAAHVTSLVPSVCPCTCAPRVCLCESCMCACVCSLCVTTYACVHVYLPRVSQYTRHMYPHVLITGNQGQVVPALSLPLNFPGPTPTAVPLAWDLIPLCEVLVSIGHQPPDLASWSSGHLVLGAVGSTQALNGGWGMNISGEEYWPSFTNSWISRLKTHLFTRGSSVFSTQASFVLRYGWFSDVR